MKAPGAAGRRHLALLLCGAAAGLAMWHGGGQTVAFLFGALAALNGYALLARWGMVRRVETQRSVEAALLAEGGGVHVSTEIHMERRPFPFVWIAVEEEWTRNGQRFCVKRRLFVLRAGQTIRYGYKLAPLPRGVYRSEGMTVTVGDLFGFVVRKRNISGNPATSGKVLAGGEPAGALEFAVWPQPDPDVGAIRRTFARRGWQEDIMWAGVREYQPGDRLSRIDWKASARGTGLKTKLFEPADDRNPVLLALDPGIAEREMFEQAVRVCAGLLHQWNKTGLRAALIDGGGAPGGTTRPGADGRMTWRPRDCGMEFGEMMHKLAAAEPDRGRRLDEMLRAAGGGREWPVRSTVVCVVGAGALDEPVAEALQHLRERRLQVVLVQLLGEGQDLLRDRNARAALKALGCEVHVIGVADGGDHSMREAR